MSFKDKGHPLCIRMCFANRGNKGFPFSDEGLRAAMEGNKSEFKFCSDQDDPDAQPEVDGAGNQIFTRTIPIDESALIRLVARNPVSAAQPFKKMFDAILETLLAIPGYAGKVTETVPIHHPSRKGVLGMITDIVANLEANGRCRADCHLRF